ncbi:UNVERIFIED_CONTAM: protein NRT1/ PTR FAMILY 5.14 [Sesamum latifolium]|uniref:Protein NRT1/ PTR FAMILY 5.14 n=1 Tax=Sesamum latifolium TaxID=2727402 RepID=A0AAW2SSQ4_9LAMI
MSSPINPNCPLPSNPYEHFTSLIDELQQQLRNSCDDMEMLKNDISRHAYYELWAERRANELDGKNSILRREIEALKVGHEVEVEQFQQENQQLRDQGLMLLYFVARRLLYVALILVALGQAGRDILLKEFLAYQFREEVSYVDEEQLESCRKIWWRPAYILGLCASVYVFANAPWIELSRISAIAIGVAFMLFLGGIAFKYKYKPSATESKLNNLRILYAAISKRHLTNSTPPGNVIPILRWLDKASVEETSPSREEQATGNTFFYEQKVPRQVMLTRVGAGMALSPVCYIVAWRIEKYRLHKYVNLDVSISVFWLIPQFFLLGVMEGLVFDGMEEVFDGHVPESFRIYAPSFTQFALNIGNFVSLDCSRTT